MSNQAYYKERLGFDPQEVIFDGPPHVKYRKVDSKHPQGYEENLTKFKGTTVWDIFIEIKGTVLGFIWFTAWILMMIF